MRTFTAHTLRKRSPDDEGRRSLPVAGPIPPMETALADIKRPSSVHSNQTPSKPIAESPTFRILLVDDDPRVRDADTLRLRRLGFTVTTCATAVEALRHIKVSPEAFHLVLADENMPEFTGLELTYVLRGAGHRLPVVLMSGYSPHLTPKHTRETEVDAVLMKPVSGTKLKNTLMELLENH